jgi:hypothetical protein
LDRAFAYPAGLSRRNFIKLIKNKAVIFTESVRTQKYFEQLLSNHGYAGELVLLNGSNADAESRKIAHIRRITRHLART